MLHFSEDIKKLINEARELFPGECCGYNYDEWSSLSEWKAWMTKKIAEEKKRRAEEAKNKNG